MKLFTLCCILALGASADALKCWQNGVPDGKGGIDFGKAGSSDCPATGAGTGCSGIDACNTCVYYKTNASGTPTATWVCVAGEYADNMKTTKGNTDVCACSDADCNKEPGCGAPAADCEAGKTFSKATGKAPCAACNACTANGIKTTCLANADTVCKAAPVAADCEAGKTFNKPTGKAPCNACNACTANGIKTACLANADTVCKAAPVGGVCKQGKTFNKDTGKEPCVACNACTGIGITKTCFPNADTVCNKPRAACVADKTFNLATGKEPCTACKTCTYQGMTGVKTPCKPKSDAVCVVLPFSIPGGVSGANTLQHAPVAVCAAAAVLAVVLV